MLTPPLTARPRRGMSGRSIGLRDIRRLRDGGDPMLRATDCEMHSPSSGGGEPDANVEAAAEPEPEVEEGVPPTEQSD